MAAVAACEDETTVAPPTPPAQITATQTYSKSSTGLPNADVYSMLTLSNGEFWVGTAQGIARYASISAPTRIAGNDGVYNELNGLPNPKVRDMAEFNGKVYVATWGGGLGIYDVAGGTWTSRTPANDGGDDVQTAAVGTQVATNGVIVTAGPNGILETQPRGDDRVSGTSILDGGNRIAQSRVWNLNGSIADIALSPTEGKIYLATNDAISIYDPTLDRFTSFVTLTRDVVSAAEVRETPAGVERWYGPRVESVENPTPPKPTPGITVSRGTSTVFTYTQANSALPEPDVNAIYYDTDGDVLWVAFATHGVAMVSVDQSTWTVYTTLQGLPSNTVYSVTRAGSPTGGSTIWVATQAGIARLEGSGKWQGYNSGGGLPSDRVREVYSDNGTNLWAGFVNGGAVRLNPASAK